MRTDLQRPYNVTDNPINVNGDEFTQILGYLQSHGVPMPQIVISKVTRPEQPPISGVPGQWTDIQLVWTDPRIPDALPSQAYLVANSPAHAVVQYRLWQGMPSAFAFPAQFVYKKVEEVVPPPPPQTWGQHENDGKPGYARREIQTPFGKQIYWEKV